MSRRVFPAVTRSTRNEEHFTFQKWCGSGLGCYNGAMIVSRLTPAPLACATTGPNSPQQPSEPEDSADIGGQEPTGFARAFSGLPRLAQGAVAGVVGFSLPVVGGMTLGYPGALGGALAPAGFSKALGNSTRTALGAAFWPAAIGCLTASAAPVPTPLKVGMMVAGGAALGMLALWREDLLDDLNGY